MRMVWVKSATDKVVRVGSVDVTGEPVEVIHDSKLGSAYRDGSIIICKEPTKRPPVKTAKTGGKK